MNLRSRSLLAAAGLLAVASPSLAKIRLGAAPSQEGVPRALQEEDSAEDREEDDPTESKSKLEETVQSMVPVTFDHSMLEEIVTAVNVAGVDLDMGQAAGAVETAGGTFDLPESHCGDPFEPGSFTCQCLCLLIATSWVFDAPIIEIFGETCFLGIVIDGGQDSFIVDGLVGGAAIINSQIQHIKGWNPLSEAINEVIGLYFLRFCRRALRPGELPVQEDIPRDRRLQIVQSMEHIGAKPDSTFSFRYDLISKKSCDALIQHLDAALERDVEAGTKLDVKAYPHGVADVYESWTPFHGGIENQYNHKLYADDLVALVGKDEAMKLIDYFEETLGDLTIDCMYLARHGRQDAGDDGLLSVPWHKDDYATVEITLNDDYDGGHVLHLNADGVHKTDARPGSATAHKDDIVHGITPNTGGAKYMLILKHHFERPEKEGVVRLSREMVNASADRELSFD